MTINPSLALPENNNVASSPSQLPLGGIESDLQLCDDDNGQLSECFDGG